MMSELLLHSLKREKTEACEERPIRGRPEAGAYWSWACAIPSAAAHSNSYLYSSTPALLTTLNSFLPTFQETHPS